MRDRGRHAEDVAATFLQQMGLSIVERNYQCRYGEIDLIARDGDALVFVEVRMRKNSAFGGAAASITPGKRDKLLRAARHYLSGCARTPVCRFDALLIDGGNSAPEWLKNVFSD